MQSITTSIRGRFRPPSSESEYTPSDQSIFESAEERPSSPENEPSIDDHEPELEIEEMATTSVIPSTNGIKEVKMNPPKPYDGSRSTFKKFLQDAEMNLLINEKMYDTDLAKIGYVLSFMTNGQAAAWATQFFDEARTNAATKNISFTFGTYNNFQKELIKAFSAYDSPGDALEQMKHLRMNSEESADEHIARFRTLLAESQLDSSSPIIIDMFRETLTIPLQKRIMNLENVPTTLDGWCESAQKHDHQWKRMRRITGRTQEKMKYPNQTKKYNFG